jgi:electron transport complex protein RnfB
MAGPAPTPRKGRPKALINPDSCTGCEVCIAVCPVDCIDKVPGPEHPGLGATCVIDQPRCIGCWLCEKICPWTAITMVPPMEPPPLPMAPAPQPAGGVT